MEQKAKENKYNGNAMSIQPEVMIQLFNSECLSVLYYGIDVCPSY